MTDPGFAAAVIGFGVTKLIDTVIEYLRKAVLCKRNGRALQSLLEDIRGDVDNIEAKLQSLRTVAQDDNVATKWWRKLCRTMEAAERVVKECFSCNTLHLYKRKQLAERIDNMRREIEKLADERTHVALHLDTHMKFQQLNYDYDAPGNAAVLQVRATRERAMWLEEQTRLRDAQNENRRHTLSDFGHDISAHVHNRFHNCFHSHHHHDNSFHDADQEQQFQYATNQEYNNVQMPQQSSTYVQYPEEYSYVTAHPAYMEPQNQTYPLNSWQ